MPITLSGRQASRADRVGGIELLIPWPETTLGPPPSGIALDCGREATASERAWAEGEVQASCQARGLLPVHVRVACVRRPASLPRGGEVALHLAVTIIGYRWVHAGGRPRPLTIFAG